jgi:apolipoprotein N-acyltransferase
VPLWCALALSVGGGIVLDLAFPDTYVWAAVFPALAAMLVALIGRSGAGAFLVGFVGALSFYLVHIPWIQEFLGGDVGLLSFVPFLGLSVFESLFWAAAAVLITLGYRWVPRHLASVPGRVLVLPAVIAGIWTLREAINSNWPFGGFSWGRLAFSQSQGPLAPLFAWIGVAGVTFLVALVTASAIEVVRVSTRETWMRAAILPVLVGVVATLVPEWSVHDAGTLRVAAVQGNGKAGYFDRAAYGELLDAQTSATLPVLDEQVPPDVVVWPEGGTDVDPQTRDEAARVFDYLTDELDAPLVSGVITERDGLVYNTSVVWRADEGVTDYYDKRHPVPFGEYVPMRSLIEPLVPQLIGMIGREYTPGTTDPIVHIGSVPVGLNICFDIVDDGLLRETVRNGAQVIFAQSNNADFGTTDESVQQLEIARIRAMESGRSVVVISTVGQSEIIRPDGSTLARVPRFEAAAMVDDVPLATSLTPATVWGSAIEWLVGLFGVLVTLIAGVLARSSRRAVDPDGGGLVTPPGQAPGT